VALNDSGEIWCAPNPRVRMQANWSMGRKKPPVKGEEAAPVRIAAIGG
jgi:hypothetical protein